MNANPFGKYQAELDQLSRMTPQERDTLHKEVATIKYTEAGCRRCMGAGLVYPRTETGKVDYSRIIPCPECATAEDRARIREQRFKRTGMIEPYDDLLASFEVNACNLSAYNATCALITGDPKARWVTISGRQGSGKSHLARGAVQKLVGVLDQVRYCYCPELLLRFKKCIDNREGIETVESIIDDLVRADLVVLDDLSSPQDKRWEWENLEAIIGGRYNRVQNGEDCRLVVTTNKNPVVDFPAPIYSRLRDARFARVVVNEDKDRRPEGKREDTKS